MQMSAQGSRRRVPGWVTAIIVVLVLPIFALPVLLNRCQSADDTRLTLLWLYPLYAVTAGVLAWMCWHERPYMTWILLVLMVMSHAAAWMLVNMP